MNCLLIRCKISGIITLLSDNQAKRRVGTTRTYACGGAKSSCEAGSFMLYSMEVVHKYEFANLYFFSFCSVILSKISIFLISYNYYFRTNTLILSFRGEIQHTIRHTENRERRNVIDRILLAITITFQASTKELHFSKEDRYHL